MDCSFPSATKSLPYHQHHQPIVLMNFHYTCFQTPLIFFIIESTINIFSDLNLSNSFSFKLKFNFGLLKINKSPLKKFKFSFTN